MAFTASTMGSSLPATKQAAETDAGCATTKASTSSGSFGKSTRSYEDKDGNKRTVSECIADDVQFLGGPRRDNAPGGYDDDYPFPDEE